MSNTCIKVRENNVRDPNQSSSSTVAILGNNIDTLNNRQIHWGVEKESISNDFPISTKKWNVGINNSGGFWADWSGEMVRSWRIWGRGNYRGAQERIHPLEQNPQSRVCKQAATRVTHTSHPHVHMHTVFAKDKTCTGELSPPNPHTQTHKNTIHSFHKSTVPGWLTVSRRFMPNTKNTSSNHIIH